MPINGGSEYGAFKPCSVEAKVGIGRTEYVRIGSERRDDRDATSDTW
jgi:hypothetical protein